MRVIELCIDGQHKLLVYHSWSHIYVTKCLRAAVEKGPALDNLRTELVQVFKALDKAVRSDEDPKEGWDAELRALIQADDRLKPLLVN